MSYILKIIYISVLTHLIKSELIEFGTCIFSISRICGYSQNEISYSPENISTNFINSVAKGISNKRENVLRRYMTYKQYLTIWAKF